ncbi:MAG: glycoside hydrolase family 3 N-terminal domain-containing protein [bacterium]|nr:glycoside hydrolase family 3 N-terminal domain-containing protein [bacterium]
MSRSIHIFALVLCTLLLFTTPAHAQNEPDFDALIAEMTLEHKVGQMFMVNLYGVGLSQAGREMLETWQPGGLFIGVSNIESFQQVANLNTTYQQTIIAAGGVPLFIATDQEGGLIQRLQEGFTRWPVSMLVTAANDADLAFRVGQGMAQELRAAGLNMNLAPVADLNTNVDNPIIGRRSPGSSPELVGLAVSNLALGMQEQGVLATVKHFPGHGDTSADSHTELPRIDYDAARLEAVELAPFQMAIDAGVSAVMVGHLWMTAYDPDTTLPASLSYNVITGLLRDQMGFEGIVTTDALEMDAIDLNFTPEEASVRAVEAGVDLLLTGVNTGEAQQARMMQAVVDAVRSGRITEARIDESVRRILSAKADMGILDWTPPTPEEQVIEADAHALLINELFEAGVTVAYDSGNHIPLNPERSAIIFPGNRAQIWRDCSPYSNAVQYMSVNDSPSEAEIATAVTLAGQVDTVVVWTRDAYLTEDLAPLVNALPAEKTVVVALISPHDWLLFPQISGYIATYSPMEAGVTTACAILFGALPARGRLAVDLSPQIPAGSRTE